MNVAVWTRVTLSATDPITCALLISLHFICPPVCLFPGSFVHIFMMAWKFQFSQTCEQVGEERNGVGVPAVALSLAHCVLSDPFYTGLRQLTIKWPWRADINTRVVLHCTHSILCVESLLLKILLYIILYYNNNCECVLKSVHKPLNLLFKNKNNKETIVSCTIKATNQRQGAICCCPWYWILALRGALIVNNALSECRML